MLNFSESFVQTGGRTRLSGGDLASSSPLELKGGELTGAGRVFARVNNSALVTPGSSPGIMDVTGAYHQDARGVLRMELAGPEPGTGHDQLMVRGQAEVGGTLEVVLLNDFVPAPGSQFDLVVSTTRVGEFAKLDMPDLPAGSAWKIEYLPTGVRLRVAAE
jgi:hypothetical protein